MLLNNLQFLLFLKRIPIAQLFMGYNFRMTTGCLYKIDLTSLRSENGQNTYLSVILRLAHITMYFGKNKVEKNMDLVKCINSN